jgi:hypothetical protein
MERSLDPAVVKEGSLSTSPVPHVPWHSTPGQCKAANRNLTIDLDDDPAVGIYLDHHRLGFYALNYV